MDYRSEPPEAEVLRLREELEATRKDRDALQMERDTIQKDRNKSKRRMWVMGTVVVGAIPPALVLRFHIPSRVLLLDVLGFAVWGWLIFGAARRRG